MNTILHTNFVWGAWIPDRGTLHCAQHLVRRDDAIVGLSGQSQTDKPQSEVCNLSLRASACSNAGIILSVLEESLSIQHSMCMFARYQETRIYGPMRLRVSWRESRNDPNGDASCIFIFRHL